jgi:mannose-6-phosphate isomerase-like protein (cupin superfamily)
MNALIRPLSLALVVLLLEVSVGLAQQAAAPATEPRVMSVDDIPWGPPGGGDGYPVGLRTARLSTDPTTGGMSYYARFPAGSRFDRHWHTHDEYVVVARGTITITLGEKVHTLGAGAYIVIPGKLSHVWDVPADQDAVIFVRRAGPADFHFVKD